jgi:hypothetical protein
MPTNGQFAVGELVTASDANTLFVRGYGNRIINGNFEINQRGYTSGTNLASGAYGFDRWKSGFTNTALTFTDGIQNTTVTISSSGVLNQVIERENMPAGTYILSWFGTATGRIYNAGSTPPGYTAGPITVTLDGLANVVVEFTASGGTRTLGLVQVEAGTVFSPFQYRHRGEEIILCQRYFTVVSPNDLSVYNPYWNVGLGSGDQRAFWKFPVRMRVTPTVLTTGGSSIHSFQYRSYNTGVTNYNLDMTGVGLDGIFGALYATTNNGGATLAIGNTQGQNNNQMNMSAEL